MPRSGFFHGAALADPAGLLEGSGKSMRHVKLRPGEPLDEDALDDLVAKAHGDIRRRLASPRAVTSVLRAACWPA